MKLVSFLLLITVMLSAETIKLPQPQKQSGMPLYEVLSKRSTSREFSSKEISDKLLSQILWSAAGVNRIKSGKRTAPSAWGNNEVELYVLMRKGTFRYNPVNHTLIQVTKEDHRKFGGKQKFVKDAPVTMVLVGDLSKIKQTKDLDEKIRTAHVDAGYISQNIYLAAAAEGLITGARAWLDFEKLTKVLKLTKDQRAIIAHSIGYAK